jgi:E3 ubiquitin-protein ligase ATL41
MAAAFVPTPNISEPEHRPATNKGTLVFSYTCVGLTGTALVAVLLFYCYHQLLRRRAPVAAAAAAGAAAETNPPGPEGHHVGGVDISKLPGFAYAQSSRRRGNGGDGAQCSVCLGAVQPGEMVRRLPLCKHLYHVECIDMWLASHATCPLCRSDVEPPGIASSTEPPETLPV